MPEPSPLDLARRALRDAPGDLEVLVAVTRRRRATFGAGPPRREQALSVEAMVARDGRAASSGRLVVEEDRVGDAVGAALEVLEALEALATRPPGGWPGLEPPRAVRPHGGHDLAIAGLSEAAIERVARAAREPAPGGAAVVVEAVERRVGLASTAGHALSDATTEAALAMTIAPVVARARAAALASLDPGGLAARTSERAALLSVLPERAPTPGEHPAVLEPEALAELLALAGTHVFSGAARALDGRLGTRVAAPSVNLSDSTRYPATLPRAFDAEGVPTAPIPLVQDGVAHRLVHDIATAAASGARSTGHATVAGRPRPRPRNLVMVGGGALELSELVAPVPYGVVVPALSAVSVDPAGPTARLRAPWALEVRDGELSGRLSALEVEAGLLDVLAGAEALSAQPRLVVPDGETAVVCPAMRTARLRVL